nr:leucokinin 3 [Aedes aegypti=mosquitoes, Peptide, 10 aa] [Aedes aegypti]
NNPNVFYPWG